MKEKQIEESIATEEKREWCVYIHTCKINNKSYIGIVKNPKQRWGYKGHNYLAKDKQGKYA